MLKKKVANVVIVVRHVELVLMPWDDTKNFVNKYSVKCTNKDTGVKISFPFFDSIHNTKNKPIEHDELMEYVLGCIGLDYHYDKVRFPTFQDFCDELDYNNDSIKDRKTYNACIRLGEKLQSVFTEEVLETLSK